MDKQTNTALINVDWVHVRKGDGDYEAYLADLDLAWEVSVGAARLQIEAGEEPAGLADCLCCTLMESGLHSWAQSSTPAVIVRAVQLGVWSPARALSFARLIPDDQRRAEMFSALAKSGLLDESQTRAAQTEAVTSAKQIEFDGSRAFTLSKIASETDEESESDALAAGLEAALRDVDSRYGMIYSLQGILWKLPDSLVPRAVAGVLAVQNPEAKAWGAAILAPRVRDAEREPLLRAGLDAVPSILQEVARANAIAQLAPQLTGELVGIALDAALALNEGDWRPRAVVGLMDRLTPEQIARTLDKMIDIDDEWWRADGLMAVIEHASGATRERALAVLLTTRDEETLGKIRGWLEYDADLDILETASTLIVQIDDTAHRERIAAMVEPILNVVRGRAADPSGFYVAAQGEIEFHYEPKPIEDELRAALDLPYEEDRSKTLAALVPRLPAHLLPDVLAAALAFEDDLYRDWALNGIAPYLDGALLERALAGRFHYDDISVSAHALPSLAAHVNEPLRLRLLTLALERARGVGQMWWRLEALEHLFPLLPPDLQRTAASTWLETANALPSTPQTESAKVRAAYHVGETVDAARFVAVIDQIWAEDESFLSMGAGFKLEYKIARIRPLLAYLPPDQKHSVIDRMIEQVVMLDDVRYVVNIIKALSPLLSADLRDRLVAKARDVADERTRSAMLGALIDDLAATAARPAYEDALAKAHALTDEKQRTRAIAQLIPIAPDPTDAILNVRLGVLAELRTLRSELRTSVLFLLSDESIFAPPVFSPSLITACADALLTVLERPFPRP